ncbi:nitronate monooxygenase [Arsenicicoccus dermatophilus]|uniref:nitronate monooxygenase n=1 Tax=Arsenicicoccus dermatophilus TaxID=1076331 RepID=UPI001F4CEDC6|nr:nitronate monooxygenase [Arsenicicoccus dermatophilus]MCH8614282.1 nitronate monooxygenase [Arsenicicoccus dermatophilus]
MTLLDTLTLPLVAAPMAGGPSTPALVAAACAAGGTGFLAAGYTTPAAVAAELAATRDLVGDRPFGVNVFVPSGSVRAAGQAAVSAYTQQLQGDADRLGVRLPEPDWSDTDAYDDKIALLTLVDPVAVVSFTFGLPAPEVVGALHDVGTQVWVTVTGEDEARHAAALGVDALVVQGCDAGGHRSTHRVEDEPNHLDALGLLPLVRDLGVPCVVAGGVATSGDVRRLLDAGARAVQVGTALLLTPEAGTSAVHRAGLRLPGMRAVVTRAFSGRPARGLRNRFVEAHDAAAPAVFPQVDQLTRPLRAAAAKAGDPQGVSLWAGAGWQAAREAPAGEVLRGLAP